MPLENNNDKRNDKRGKKGIYAFLDRQGFYIVLLLCVCIVGVTAFWVTTQEPDNQYLTEENWRDEEDDYRRPDVTLVEENTEDIEDPDQVVMGNETKEPTNELKIEEKKINENVSMDNEDDKPQDNKAEPSSNTAVVHNMIMPVEGEIGLPYSADKLVFHATLNQWRTHKGLDIHAKEGTPVRTVLDGEVIEVITDRLMGIVITVQHDENLLTRYSNLSTGAMVSVGDFVEKGQVISAVGKTSITKTEEGPLLHFQVINDTKLVDPQLYLPKNN